MMLHVGERVYWGAPEVIYLEGKITSLNEQKQIAIVHIERATPHSAHLIGSSVPFSADGVKPLSGDSPPGTTDQRRMQRLPPQQMSDDEKIRRTAAVAIHERYGYKLPEEQEKELIDQVAHALNSDTALRTRIIASMDEVLKREF
ncbi:MAG: hypothetical protein J2P37_06130 [Ktedonobacteraceae bacterium]|nr:hypothetical protein [Ktedonobacteraceae bacterium]